MTIRSRLSSLAIVLGCLTPLAGQAQTIGGPVPPYEAPPPAALPQRGEEVFTAAPRANPFASQEQLVGDFAAAYQKAGRPRLAFYWNRQLTDTLSNWYSDVRVVATTKSQDSLSGDFNLQESGTRQTTGEVQRRTGDRAQQRLQPSENWEWEFQDGFLAPFLKSGAIVLDRAAIVRMTGAMTKGSDDQGVEVMALQGMADLLVEVLVAPREQSSVGYELRARILDTKTGQILSYVSSRALKEWNPPKPAVATDRGFVLPEDDDEDEAFGPEKAGNGTYKATPQGFERKRRPPKLSAISENLAYNVMNGMMARWR